MTDLTAADSWRGDECQSHARDSSLTCSKRNQSAHAVIVLDVFTALRRQSTGLYAPPPDNNECRRAAYGPSQLTGIRDNDVYDSAIHSTVPTSSLTWSYKLYC